MPNPKVEPEELRVLDDAVRKVVKILIAQGNDDLDITYVLNRHLAHKVADVLAEERAL